MEKINGRHAEGCDCGECLLMPDEATDAVDTGDLLHELVAWHKEVVDIDRRVAELQEERAAARRREIELEGRVRAFLVAARPGVRAVLVRHGRYNTELYTVMLGPRSDGVTIEPVVESWQLATRAAGRASEAHADAT